MCVTIHFTKENGFEGTEAVITTLRDLAAYWHYPIPIAKEYNTKEIDALEGNICLCCVDIDAFCKEYGLKYYQEGMDIYIQFDCSENQD